ncbi:hypothetical protein J2Z83_002072 [Virgibacillus natechei]|uniref:ATP-binding protein n=1 Tax=Virgibacillus natechei TaxID=1216297 RepID=A0ABS4IG96_9BACI|nr:hypothetical protein [Virgibacillus natechei]MBP1969964.1 hypothetical protein [Virgibacillus natechei]UZD13376.1 hypothetical protein OLD84_02105 [Virgibacillus natechei]
MSNAVIVPLTADQELVITADNSGAIGEKSRDEVHTSNSVVGYSALRVAMMECLAVGAEPRTIVMQNFTGDNAWEDYKNGAEDVLKALKLDMLPITGSTESNFASLQSGLGVTVIGTRIEGNRDPEWTGEEAFAVIGAPLVGNEVLEKQDEVIPLALFQQLCQMEEVKDVLPVGSKGVAVAWRKWTKRENKLSCDVDLEKSAGPSTCVLIAFGNSNIEIIREVTGVYFHMLVPDDNSC